MLSAAIVWAMLLVFYLTKWFWFRNEALAELWHPVQLLWITQQSLTASYWAFSFGVTAIASKAIAVTPK